MPRIGIIGTGTVGSAVALLLQQKGYTIAAVCSKNGKSSEELAKKLGCRNVTAPEDVLDLAEIIFITTPDREIVNISDILHASGKVTPNHLFFHMSGALPAEALTSLKESNAAVCSLHPLQSFANVEKAMQNLPGSYFAIQGDERAKEIAYKFVELLNGVPFEIKSEDKALYHLGASVASNYLVSLIHFAVTIYQKIGMTSEQAVASLMPLVKGTLANIEGLGPVKALTGPVARGDVNTIIKHLNALEHINEPELTGLYKALGQYTAEVAVQKKSISFEEMREVQKLLNERGS